MMMERNTVGIKHDYNTRQMNNHIITIGLLAALAVSCSIHEVDQRDSFPSSDKVFYAQMETPAGDGQTKVYVDDDLMVLWHADDRVSIFNKYTYNQEYRFTGKTGANSGSFKKVPNDDFITGNALDLVYAVYPFQESTEISNQGVLSIDLPATQSYSENSFGIGANTMVSCSEGNELMFKNLCGYLMLKLYGDDVTVTSISLKGNNGEPLAGIATVNASADSTPTLAFGSDVAKEISLTFDTPVKLGTTAENATTFWIVVPPTAFSKGFTLKVKDNKSGVFEKATTKSFEIKRNKLARMSALEIKSTTPSSSSTLKDFAKEFVKGLDVWKTTIGTVESNAYHLISQGTAWKNVHYIPVGHIGSGYDDHGGNQYDETLHPAWTINVDGKTYTSAQAYEIAIKGLLNMVIAEGEAFLQTMDDCNKAYTLANNKSFNELSMATPTDIAKWSYPWYEDDDINTSMTYNYLPVESVDINFVVKAVSWHLVRANQLGQIGNFQRFGTSPNTLNLEGYEGNISAMRELLILMRIYKYLLDNNIDEHVYSAIKDQMFDYDLYGIGIPSIPIPEAIDLGLPSGLKWASFNLGASVPEDYGDYFAWGETEPYYSSLNPLIWKEGREAGYDWASYRWCNGEADKLIKYCPVNMASYWDGTGAPDDKTILDSEDDVAYASLGGNWRMPTEDDRKELIDNCIWTWTMQDGVAGRLVTANNDNSIFLPAAHGYYYTYFYDDDFYGRYWSSSLEADTPYYARYVCFSSADASISRLNHDRRYGLSIRPVYAE